MSEVKIACPEQLPVKPCGYRILVKQKTKSNISAGGIHLGTDKETVRQQKGQCFGVVKALGPEAYDKNKEPWCKEGDTVRYRAYTGELFKDKYDDDVWWHLMNDEDVLGVVTEGHEG